MRVIAAIPNFNMLSNLKPLLKSMLAESFDDVYLLDDASDDGSVEFVTAHFPGVKVLRGNRNVGAGGNRNRILPELSGDELVLFVDADLDVRSKGLVGIAQEWFADEKVGLVGGLILAKAGRPMFWNYGPAMSPGHDHRNEVYDLVKANSRVDSRAFKAVREMASQRGDTYNFEIQYAEPKSRRVDWVAEGLFAVRAGLFKELGGFDRRFRYHSDQDLGVRAKEAGYEVWFKPDIVARHLELDVRGEQRREEFRAGLFLYYKKHWGMSRRVFERLFPEDDEEAGKNP